MLDSPEAIHAFPHASSEAIEHTLAFLAENYQFIIIDAPPGLTEDTCAAIRQSDRLAIVITPGAAGDSQCAALNRVPDELALSG